MQKFHKELRHTIPRLRNNKYTQVERKPEKNVTPQKIAIRPTHRKIKTKAISHLAPLDGQPNFKANGT
jgi:hypothetical protein